MPKTHALLLIDVQRGFDDPFWGKRNNPRAEENIQKLLSIFRDRKKPIIHIQHLSRSLDSPLHPKESGVEFMNFAKPIFGERIFQKNVNSAFIGTNLEEILRQDGITDLVVVGISTDHCVSTTVRMAANLGFNTWLIADATIAFERKAYDGTCYPADTVHAVALASLHDEFSTVMNTNRAIELLNSN